jgi:hypothetical protein
MAARELTPTEVAEGERNISDKQLTATEIQALVRNMDHSKKKWRHLRREEFMEKMKMEKRVSRMYSDLHLHQVHQ